MCDNQVFTKEGMKKCGDQKEDGTQFYCYPCLEGMINGAHSAVEALAVALHLVRDEYATSNELSQDTIDGIGEMLEELGYQAPSEPERPVYPH